jgi:hypothetical protein
MQIAGPCPGFIFILIIGKDTIINIAMLSAAEG